MSSLRASLHPRKTHFLKSTFESFIDNFWHYSLYNNYGRIWYQNDGKTFSMEQWALIKEISIFEFSANFFINLRYIFGHNDLDF